jgi:choice-of-anchor A domain-containing protein
MRATTALCLLMPCLSACDLDFQLGDLPDSDGSELSCSPDAGGGAEPPVLTLVGPAVQSQECRTPYVDPGARATDACFGDLSSSIVRTGSVNSDVPASYTLTYAVSDPAGNSAPPVSRSVNVSDTLSPTLTVSGPANLRLECGSAFVDPGAVANDQCAGPLPVEATGDIDPNVPGNYTLEYRATDPSGHGVSATRPVEVVDTLPPTLVLTGPSRSALECGTPYIDPGASAMDQCMGDLTDAITVIGSVNPRIPDDYLLQYTVSDGTHSVSRNREVTVYDTLQPVITVLGPLNDSFECDSVYADPGATATDACAGDLTGAIVATRQPIASPPNSFTITYSVSDPSGNVSVSPVQRTVTAIDVEPPLLTLLGPAHLTLECGTPYVDPGAIAEDVCSGDLTSQIVRAGTVISDSPALYTLEYNVSDPAGNSAPPVTRTVNVVDTLPPTLTIFRPPNLSLECGIDTLIDPEIWVSDQCAGVLPIERIGSIDSNVPGNYTLEYRATDRSGHVASATFSAVVADTLPPEPFRPHPGPLFHECGTPFRATYAYDACAGQLPVAILGALDPNVPGNYSIGYQAEDPSGHVTVSSFTDLVEVHDTFRPELQMLPGPSIIECNGTPYVDPGATASDSCYGDLTQDITVTSNLDQSRSGVYTITYSVTDSAGNVSMASRSITVGPCALTPSSPRDSAARLAELSRLSSQLAGLTTNGTTRFETPGSILLRGTAPALNVFDLDALALTDATRLSIDAPAGSLVVVNIYGDSATFAGLERSFRGGIGPEGILYNFVDATDINADGCQFGGTVLAPYGQMQLQRGSRESSSPGAMRCSEAEGVWIRP